MGYNPFVPPQPNDEIWYTSTDGNIVNPNNVNAFDANILSNTYENGKGIIKFDGDVTSIGEGAFHNTGLTSIEIPSVTIIGESAFSYCDSLTSITIGSSVTSIGVAAFDRCPSLTSVTIPDSVTSISNGVFRDCSSLTEIVIPNSVTSIGETAFQGCTSLTSVTIPDSVTSISLGAFYRCLFTKENFINNSSLDEVENNYWDARIYDFEINGMLINDTVLCYARKNIISADIPNFVTYIQGYVFYEYENLETVIIPDSVIEIEDAVFASCISLKSVTCLSTTPPNLGGGVFYDTNNCPIYVPSESVELYKTATDWIDYAARIQAIPE